LCGGFFQELEKRVCGGARERVQGAGFLREEFIMAAEFLDRLLEDIKSAMKSRDQETLTALRTLHAAIKDATTNAGKDPTDEAVAAVVAKLLKQLADSFEQFKAAGRTDLSDKAEKEIAIYRKYQPQQLDAAAVEALVKEAIAETGATSKKDMGKVMQAVMAKAKGKADGKTVSGIVGRLLP
jgi:uncharacterized protein YqeY